MLLPILNHFNNYILKDYKNMNINELLIYYKVYIK